MRGSLTGSLSRLATVALVVSSFTVPLLLEAWPAMARTSGVGVGATGATGATGGSTGSSGASGTGGANYKAVGAVDLPPGHYHFVRRDRLSHGNSCYQSQPMFDQWGDYVGKQQLPDFCY